MGDYIDRIAFHDGALAADLAMRRFEPSFGRYSIEDPRTQQTGATMNRGNIQRQIESLSRQIGTLQDMLDAMAEFTAVSDLEDGSVISFEYAFNSGMRFYSYAAIKVDGQWFTTGPKSPKAYDDEEFVRWLADAYQVRDLRVRGRGRKLA